MDFFFGLFLKAKFPLFFGTVSNRHVMDEKVDCCGFSKARSKYYECLTATVRKGKA
jgi:hypothetical protein